MNGHTLKQRAQRYWIPLWLVDGQVRATWQARVGYDYQVVSYQDRYRDGAGWQSQEVQETRKRWEPRAGRLDRRYENLPAPALDDHRKLMGRLGDYALERRESYETNAIEASVVRIPTLEPEAAWPGAQAALLRAARTECRKAAEADHIRDFTAEAQYDNLNWTLLLLPAYVTWYKEGDHIWPLLINGQSGRVSGVRRASTKKASIVSLVVGAIALIMLLLGGVLALAGLLFPPLLAVGGTILLVGLLPTIMAPIPIITAWTANRKST
jgi:hypothetical protein